jgi:hypothetical protein
VGKCGQGGEKRVCVTSGVGVQISGEEVFKKESARVVMASEHENWSARFLALKTQVDGVRDKLGQYEQVLRVVKGVQASLAKGYIGYTGAVRGDVDDELETVEHVLGEWHKAVQEARDLLEQTRAVNAPGAAGAAQEGVVAEVQELDMSQLLRRMQDVCE